MTLIGYMESHFQEEFASLEDKTAARTQVIHVFQCGGFVAMSLQAVSLRQPHEIEALLVLRTTQIFSKWPGIQPEVARNTTEIEYVLVPRTQLDCNDKDLLYNGSSCAIVLCWWLVSAQDFNSERKESTVKWKTAEKTQPLQQYSS